MHNFILQRKLPAVFLGDIESENGIGIKVLSIDFITCDTLTEQDLEDLATREDALFTFLVKEQPDLDAASRKLDLLVDELFA